MVKVMLAVLNACADETRLRLLNLLAGSREMCVSDLVEAIGTSQPKVSRHLAYLRRSQLVRERKEGLHVYYRLATVAECSARPVVDAILDWLDDSESPPVESTPSEPALSIELL